MKEDSDTNCGWCIWGNPQWIFKGMRRLGNNCTNRNDTDYSIIWIGQNSEKSPGHLMRLAITRTREGNHKLTLV